MSNFATWEQRNLSVDNLRLDPVNPRLPEIMQGENQTNIRHYLIDSFNVLEIAQSIVRHGFFPNEAPIVVKEKNHFVVLEGNRRVAALQVLRNPDLAPPGKKATYRALAREIDTAIWAKIITFIAPTRLDAAPILLARHGDGQISNWKHTMRMRYLAKPILDGASIVEFSQTVGVPQGDLRQAVIEILIRQMLIESNISETEKELYTSEDFPLTTMWRIIGDAAFKEITGLDVAGTTLKYAIGDETFLSIIMQICSDISGKSPVKNSRDLNDKDSRKSYIDNILKPISDRGTREPGSYTPKNLPTPQPKPEPRKRQARSPQEKLIPESFDVVTGHTKLDALLAEGKKMPLGVYPLCGAMNYRLAFELGIIKILTDHGLDSAIRNKNGSTKGLKQLLQVLLENPQCLRDVRQKDRLARFASDDNPTFIHFETLHHYVHSEGGIPSKDQLRALWGEIADFLQLASKTNC